MSKFLMEVKDQSEIDNIAKWIRIGERADERPVSAELFNFMVDVGKAIQDPRAGLRAYHWLKWCVKFYNDNGTMILNYTDRNSANWALNYIGNGIKFSQKCQNIAVFYNGTYIDSLFPPDRKKGKVWAVRN